MPIKIEIEVDESGAVKSIRRTETALEGLDNTARKSTGIKKTQTDIDRLNESFKGAIAGYLTFQTVMSGTRFAKGFADTAGSFEAMRISLDTMTKGRGQEWMTKLTEWARTMPVSTEQAIESFTLLRAMGLEPTIKDMTTLVDVASSMPSDPTALTGIARALGQIQTKGKVSAEELMQLAERGIPAYQILQDKLGLTAKQVQNIGNESIDGREAVRALLEGMNEQFGGQSKKLQDAYRGIISTIRDDWKLYQNEMMDGASFEFVKSKLKEIDSLVNSLRDKQKTSNDLQKYLGVKPEGSFLEKVLLPNWSFGLSRLIPRSASDRQILELQNAIREYEKKNNPVMSWDELMKAQGKNPKTPTPGNSEPKKLSALEKQNLANLQKLRMTFGMGTFAGINAPATGSGDGMAYTNPGLGQFGASNWDAMAYERQEELKERMKELNLSYEESRIQLEMDGAEQSKALLQARFDSEWSIISVNDERRVVAQRTLENQLAAIDQEASDKMMNNAIAFGRVWGNTLAGAVMESGNAFENIAESFRKMLVTMTAQSLATGLFSGIFNIATGGAGGFGGGFLAGFKSVFGGGRAGGGNVYPGNVYPVGENGMELFSPSVAGRIIPNREVKNYTTSSAAFYLGNSSVSDADFVDQLRRVVRDNPRLKRVFLEAAS